MTPLSEQIRTEGGADRSLVAGKTGEASFLLPTIHGGGRLGALWGDARRTGSIEIPIGKSLVESYTTLEAHGVERVRLVGA